MVLLVLVILTSATVGIAVVAGGCTLFEFVSVCRISFVFEVVLMLTFMVDVLTVLDSEAVVVLSADPCCVKFVVSSVGPLGSVAAYDRVVIT